LTLELLHSHGWEGRSSVVLGLVFVNLVDWNGGVDDRGLNSLLLDDRLDVLVNVVVNVLADDVSASRLRGLHISNFTSALELSLFGCKTLADVVIITVLEVSLLNRGHVVFVFFWKNLFVLDRLDGSVVVVLVNLTVYNLGCILVLCSDDTLVGNGWVDSLVDRGVVLPIPGEESRNCLLCLVHVD